MSSYSHLLERFVRIDATSWLFLAVVNPIFLGISFYVWNRASASLFLRKEAVRFSVFSLIFIVATNAAIVSNHLLAIWLALEGTTLAAAPLIVRKRQPSSQLASWQYLLFSTVGLGLILLGFTCLEHGMDALGVPSTFFVDQIPNAVREGTNTWTKLGLSLTLLGLGTKLGLAPLHTWLPETYDEAPPSVTALLAAVQFNCALVFLFRIVQVYRSANSSLISGMLVAIGLASMLVSTLNLIATRNLKRLISYASINHAGVIAIGLGVGRSASYGLLLYVVSNAFIKAILFLTAGRIGAQYKTNSTGQITGLLKHLPYSGVFLMVGTFALLGFPPFGSFFGELLILSALVSSNHMFVFSAFCMLITMSFVATGRTIFPMIWGEPKEKRDWPKQTFVASSPKIAFLIILLVLGIYIPAVANDLFHQVESSLGGP